MEPEIDVLVAGGGISGLAVLRCLEARSLRAELWERRESLGGKIQSHRRDGYLMEAAATMVLNFRPEVGRFLDAAGLSGSKILRRACAAKNRYLLRDGALHRVPASLPEFFTTGVWSGRTKRRLFTEWLIPKGGRADESVADFIRRRLGAEVLERAIEPFVAGTLASDPEQANAFTVLPRLTALEQRYGSLTAGVLAHKALRRKSGCVNEVFSFRDGMTELVSGLAQAGRSPIRCNHRLREIQRLASGWRATAQTPRGEIVRTARHLVIASPADSAADLLRPADAALAALLESIRYAPLSVVHLGFDRRHVGIELDGTGFLVPRGENRAITGCLWSSALFDGRAPPGKVLLSTYLGGARMPEAAAWDEQASVSRVMSDLQGPMRLRGDPELACIHRHRRALPLYHGRHHALTAAIKERVRRLGGLTLAGNYMDGVSVRDRIVQAGIAARNVADALAQSSQHRRPIECDVDLGAGWVGA